MRKSCPERTSDRANRRSGTSAGAIKQMFKCIRKMQLRNRSGGGWRGFGRIRTRAREKVRASLALFLHGPGDPCHNALGIRERWLAIRSRYGRLGGKAGVPARSPGEESAKRAFQRKRSRTRWTRAGQPVPRKNGRWLRTTVPVNLDGRLVFGGGRGVVGEVFFAVGGLQKGLKGGAFFEVRQRPAQVLLVAIEQVGDAPPVLQQ